MVGGTDCGVNLQPESEKVGGTDLTQASSQGKKVGGTDLKWWVAPIAIAIHRLRLRTNAQNANLENAINESKGR